MPKTNRQLNQERAELAEKKEKLCFLIEDRMEDIAAEYKGLVSQEAFTNIASGIWESINDEDSGVLFPSKGDEYLL